MAPNPDPRSVFHALRTVAVEAAMPTEPIDGIACVGGYQSGAEMNRSIFAGFSLSTFISKASGAVPADKITTILQETQTEVPPDADLSFFGGILPAATQPIVQKLVDASTITIESIVITEPTADAFVAEIAASITNVGPFDAKLSAPEGLIIQWSGTPIGKLNIPDVEIVGDVGGKLKSKCTFEITDVKHITEFVKTLLTSETFEWTITGNNLVVSSLGITVPNINLGQKTVSLKGYNGFKDNLAVKALDLKAASDGHGVDRTVKLAFTNPSSLGISVDRLGFHLFTGSVFLGPANASSSFNLPPHGTVEVTLVGKGIPQTSDEGLAGLSRAMANFINGKPYTVDYRGIFLGPESATWLTEGFKALSLPLSPPGLSKIDVVKSIEIDEVSCRIKDRVLRPLSDFKGLRLDFQFPFPIPIDVVELELDIICHLHKSPWAHVHLPMAPCTTDVENRVIRWEHKEQEIVIDADHGTFLVFLKDMIMGVARESFIYSGTLSVKAKTPVGVLTIEDITYSDLEVHAIGLTLPNILGRIMSTALHTLHLDYPVVPFSVRAAPRK